ncbi:sporulation protein [Haladaptatus sp. NG-WS-4]
MKRILSRVGIGAARVDTVLPKTTLTAGESVEVEVHVEGGGRPNRTSTRYISPS